MSKIDDLQESIDNFLTRPVPVAKAAPKTEGLEAAGLEAAPRARFSLFNPADSRRANALAREFVKTADSMEGVDAVEAVVKKMQEVAEVEDPEMVDFALKMFLTHDPRGRLFKIRSLEKLSPEKFTPSAPAMTTSAESAEGGLESLAPATEREIQLNWFREDVKANEHHEHWHVVYPHDGNPLTGKLNDRHSELFLYMHQQMLARYDTERITLGMERVKPLDKYDAPIEEGYNPGPGLTKSQQYRSRYSARKSGMRIKDQAGLDELENARKQIQAAIEHGKFSSGTKINVQSLGAVMEPADDGSRKVADWEGNHGLGHNLICQMTVTKKHPDAGVMIDPAVSIRDPVFWRWHKHIDDFSFAWQETLESHNLADGAAAVKIRHSLKDSKSQSQSPDIILCFQDEQNVKDSSNAEFDWQKFGEENFGGANWNKDFSKGKVTTNELQTMMLKRQLQLTKRKSVPITYLDQRPFCYFFRVENQKNAAQDVTLRLFLVASEAAEDRRMWIELDKFRHTLKPREKAVVYRAASEASVIRKPAIKPPGPYDDPYDDQTGGMKSYCNCGWPYNLLVPRGRANGMRFRLMVMATDWTSDKISESECGSMSFCGARNNRYPDKREMGYPFNRPFPKNSSIAKTLAKHKHIASREIKIRWVE